jgi:GTPase
VDVAAIEERDPLKDFEVINEELKDYNPLLASRPQVVAANKIDILGDEGSFENFAREIEAKGYKVFPISAATNKGLKELMFYVSEKLKEIPDTILIDTSLEEVVYTAEQEKPFEIHKEEDKFVVEGNWIKKIVGSTNFNDHESLQYFQRAIKSKGIVDGLESMGINEGDIVKIYNIEFEFVR